MKVHYGLDNEAGIKRSVVTTGTFDGVHIGHQVIIRRINELAAEIDAESVLITFHPHPRKVLYPDTLGKEIRMINTQREKILLLEETGLDHLVIMPFTIEFARTPAEDFIRNILVGKLKIKKSVVGFNHFFGFNKEGNYRQLEDLGTELGFSVEEIPEQDIQNETVSSTRIRKALEEGNIRRANAYLNNIFMMMGVPFAVTGRLPDYPAEKTYLLKAEEEEKLLPPAGIYAIRIKQGCSDIKALAINNFRLAEPGSVRILPLEDILIEPDPGTRVFFYKKLLADHPEELMISKASVDRAKKEAEELIY